MMRKLAWKGHLDQLVRNVAVDVTTAGFLDGTGLKQKDFAGEARRLLAYVRDDIRYVLDPAGAEMLHDPATLLRIGAGDCDDKAILLAALLMSVGHTPRFIAAAWRPDQFDHVWVQDLIDGRWLDLEPTEPLPFGEAVPHADARVITLPAWMD